MALLMLVQSTLLPVHAAAMLQPAAVAVYVSSEHAHHGQQTHHEHGVVADDCVLSMGAACIQLCSLCTLTAPATLGPGQGEPGFTLQAQTLWAAPFIDDPAPPPKY